MKIYRLQHSVTKKGPYTHHIDNFNIRAVCGDVNIRNCPPPDSDTQLINNFRNFSNYNNTYLHISSIIKDKWIFAFSDLFQLKKWFGSKGISSLINQYGFEVVVKEIQDDKVVIGSSQCIVEINEWFNNPIVEYFVPIIE